jgi:type II secretory pathway pseudopilin PulG
VLSRTIAPAVYAEEVVTEELPPEPPLRTCPSCGRESQTRNERCPFCQTSYYAATHDQRRRRWLIGTTVAIVLIASLTVIAVIALGDRSDRDAANKIEQTRRVAALRVRIARQQAPHRGAAQDLKPPPHATDAQLLAARKELVGAVERRITDDARARVKTGELTGPFSHTTCGPILKSKAAIPDDRVLSKSIGRYDCVAVKRDVTLRPGQKVAELGYAFVAALNFNTYTYTWCRNNPAQGEAGKALVFVRLARACLAARGKALGTGYVAEPGEQGTTTDGG